MAELNTGPRSHRLRRLKRGLSSARTRLSAPLFFPEPKNAVHPARQVPDKRAEHLRLFSLNIAHARRNVPIKPFIRRHRAHRNLVEIAKTVKAVTPDVVALQEVDGPSTWSGNFDHLATLAREADLVDHYRGDHSAFGIGRFNVAFGTALLARRPLIEPSSHRFGMSWRDTKGFVVATVTVPEWDDAEIDVASVHLDFLTLKVRHRQISRLIEVFSERSRPLVVLGDLNCCWQHEPRTMDLLVESLGLRAHEPESLVPTYPAHRPRRRIDWILVSSELEFAGYHTVHAPLSDHLVLVADLALRERSCDRASSS